jgi:hypothetical protein
VADLEIASFGAWDSGTAEVSSVVKPDQPAYRKLLWQGDRLIGAIILGVSTDIWTTNDVGMLKGLVQSGSGLGPWKEYLRRNPFDIKKAFLASRTTAQLLPQKILARPSIPAGHVSA